MILQRLDSILDVSVYPDSIRKALEYLRDTDFSLLEDGEYEIEGRSIFARVFTLESKEKEESRAEYHEKECHRLEDIHKSVKEFWKHNVLLRSGIRLEAGPGKRVQKEYIQTT